MYHVVIKDNKGNIIYQNTEVSNIAEGVDILEKEFEGITDCDDYVVDFGLNNQSV